MNDATTIAKQEPVRKFCNRRLAREWKTVTAMIRIHCRDRHEGALCGECQALLRYVSLRLDRCRFGENKPACAKCLVHCYQRNYREQIRSVMRYAGPRMVWLHPWLGFRHLLDGLLRRPAPARGAVKES